MRDYQQGKVYGWERNFKEGPWSNFNEIQTIVNYIWNDLSLKYPPQVDKLHNKDKALGRANRLKVYFPEKGASLLTILHELAHSLTAKVDDYTHQHNEYFVGMYMTLLNKYLGYEYPVLWYLANKYGVQFQLNVRPLIEDGQSIYG